jgi:4-alpha-glucanotransferase
MYYVPTVEGVAGAYMQFNFYDLLGIVCLESVRNKCVVIAEDLGTPPLGLRESLQEAGLLTMNFLRNNFYNFAVNELLIVGTHDMSTLPAFWRGDDIKLFDRYGMKQAETIHYEERRNWRKNLIIELSHKGIFFAQGEQVLEGAESEPELVRAVYQFASGKDSQLLAVQLEDVFEQYEQVNLPGTFMEYPNWRYKLPVPVEKMAADPRMIKVAKVLANRSGAAGFSG